MSTKTKEGILFVISGPSGVGKGTVMKEVFAKINDLHFSVSATTRKPRAGEKDGVNYYYVSNEKFDEMIENGEMLEYISKYKNRYGTPKYAVENLLKEGKDVLLEIETIGAENVKKAMPECVSVFIAPPSLAELKKRLNGRNTETEEEAEIRFKLAYEEIKCARTYNYVVLNDDVKTCAEKIASIIVAERNRLCRNEYIIDKILEN